MANFQANLKNSFQTFQSTKVNYQLKSLGWFDNERGLNSCWGSNITDWTLADSKTNNCHLFLGCDNYNDQTTTLSANKLAVIVGNHQAGNTNLNAITLDNFLTNFGKYSAHRNIPEDLNLSSGDNELVTIRYIAVVLPEELDGQCEVVPMSYNYQTHDDKNPKNYLTSSFHMGIGTRFDASNKQPVYLISHDKSGRPRNNFFKITNEDKETEEQKKSVATVLGTKSTGVGRNRVQLIQIPRLKDPEPTTRGGGNSGYESDECCSLSVNSSMKFKESRCQQQKIATGNVSFGSDAGEYTLPELPSHKRNSLERVTVTFAFYFTSKDGNLSSRDWSQIVETLDKSYKDINGDWTGSLVTGQKNTEIKSEYQTPPNPFKELNLADVKEIQTKLDQYPSNIAQVQTFPDNK